jgi:hypothetical protein
MADETAVDSLDTLHLCECEPTTLRYCLASELTLLHSQVVAVQQGIYRAAALPRFDPSRLCEELFQPWVNRTDREMMQDSVLVAHVRLALILQSWRKATDMPAGSSAASNVGIYQIVDFNTRLDRWMSELDQVGVASEHREYLAPIWLYARIVINMAGASVPHAESANLFCGNAMRAARSLVDLFGGERLMEQLPLLPPFYIEVSGAKEGLTGLGWCV